MFNIATHMVSGNSVKKPSILVTNLSDFQLAQDFEGQGRAEKLSRVIITLFGAVGLIWGYIIQQFSQTVYILIAGVLLASIVSFSL